MEAKDVEHCFIDRPDGTKFHYVSYGPKDGPEDTIMFIHGFPEFWYEWRHVMAVLGAAPHDYRCLAIDMRGFGQTEIPSADVKFVTDDAVVGDIIAMLDKEGIDKIHIVGHDWGAMPTWLAVRQHPDRFKSVTGLSVPCPNPNVGPTPEEAQAMGASLLYQAIFARNDCRDTEEEFSADSERALKALFSMDDAESGKTLPTDPEGSLFQNLGEVKFPDYMSQAELDTYLDSIKSAKNVHGGKENGGGWRAMLLWYTEQRRALNTAHMKDNNVSLDLAMPVQMIMAEYDIAMHWMVTAMKGICKSGFRRLTCQKTGHWMPTAKPKWVAEKVNDFISAVNKGESVDSEEAGQVSG